jgi:hypothetical protein
MAGFIGGAAGLSSGCGHATYGGDGCQEMMAKQGIAPFGRGLPGR